LENVVLVEEVFDLLDVGHGCYCAVLGLDLVGEEVDVVSEGVSLTAVVNGFEFDEGGLEEAKDMGWVVPNEIDSADVAEVAVEVVEVPGCAETEITLEHLDGGWGIGGTQQCGEGVDYWWHDFIHIPLQ
jgi:hypothetical protein